MNDVVTRPPYASYLPPVYLDAPDGVLARLVALFEALMAGMENAPLRVLAPGRTEAVPGLEQLLDGIERYSDPLEAPAGSADDGGATRFFDDDFLPYLAGWVALGLRQHWPEAKKRRLIAGIVPLYKLRGTLEGIARILEIFVESPVRIREELGIQVGVRATVDVDTTVGGLPHRFRVEIPYGYREAGEPNPRRFDFEFLRFLSGNVREVLDLEKPAHTDYEAVYDLPGIVVGEYSTVEWDTVIWPSRGARPID